MIVVKKIAIVEDCFECPFFVDNEWDIVKKSRCKKANVWGNQTDIFNVCPLPNYDDEKVYDDKNLQKTDDGFWSWKQ